MGGSIEQARKIQTEVRPIGDHHQCGVVPLLGRVATVLFSRVTEVAEIESTVTVGSPSKLRFAASVSTPVAKVKPRVTVAVTAIMQSPSSHSHRPLSLRAIHGES